jgi:RNA polymerase sigma-70 factor (ECF subfamily)
MLNKDNVVQDRFARGIIRRKIRLLIGRAGFTKEDREDLEQELVLRLLQSLDLFDRQQAHANVFITTVIERAVAMILRERRAKKRNSGVIHSLDQIEDGCPIEPADPRPNAEEAYELAYDLADVLADLPEELRNLAERLKAHSVSRVARDFAVPRSTLQRKVRRLRQIFVDAGLQIYT